MLYSKLSPARACAALCRLALALCCALTAASAAAAQTTTSTLTGEVRDTNGALVEGAAVTARSIETNQTRTVQSNAEGRYTFPALPVGAYEVQTEKVGFQRTTERIRLTVGETATLNLTVAVAGHDESVTVTDETAAVNTQTQELSYLVGERLIRDLPLNGRNYTDLALLQPGVIGYPHRDGGSVVAHGLGVSVNGQDPRSNVYLLDGTPQNDFTNGPAGSAAGTSLGQETIREFRVEVNSYSAEYGRNFGGQVNAVTKSGTNQFHGSLYEYHRNDNLDARNFFDPARKPEFKRNQFGGSIGGPIRRDRLFFFFGYESLRENLGRTISSVVPNLAARSGVLPNPNVPGQTINVAVSPVVRPYLNEFPLPNGPNLASASTSSFASISSKGGLTTTAATATNSSRAIPSTTQTSGSQPTFRNSRARSCRAINSSPANTGRR
jgi:hypothetical protein